MSSSSEPTTPASAPKVKKDGVIVRTAKFGLKAAFVVGTAGLGGIVLLARRRRKKRLAELAATGKLPKKSRLQRFTSNLVKTAVAAGVIYGGYKAYESYNRPKAVGAPKPVNVQYDPSKAKYNLEITDTDRELRDIGKNEELMDKYLSPEQAAALKRSRAAHAQAQAADQQQAEALESIEAPATPAPEEVKPQEVSAPVATPVEAPAPAVETPVEPQAATVSEPVETSQAPATESAPQYKAADPASLFASMVGEAPEATATAAEPEASVVYDKVTDDELKTYSRISGVVLKSQDAEYLSSYSPDSRAQVAKVVEAAVSEKIRMDLFVPKGGSMAEVVMGNIANLASKKLKGSNKKNPEAAQGYIDTLVEQSKADPAAIYALVDFTHGSKIVSSLFGPKAAEQGRELQEKLAEELGVSIGNQRKISGLMGNVRNALPGQKKAEPAKPAADVETPSN